MKTTYILIFHPTKLKNLLIFNIFTVVTSHLNISKHFMSPSFMLMKKPILDCIKGVGFIYGQNKIITLNYIL